MKTLLFTLIVILFYTSQGNLFAQVLVWPSDRSQVETPIAINPTNPNNIIGAAITQGSTSNRIGVYYSMDGGENWIGQEDLFTPEYNSGDPVIAFDPDGVAYLLYQVRDHNRLYLFVSYNGGADWTEQSEIIITPDKPWLAISPIRNEQTKKFDIYISVTQDNTPEVNDISLLKSTDGGSHFQNKYSVAAFEGYNIQGSSVDVGPEGEVVLAWADIGPPQKEPETKRIHVRRSADGGTTFVDDKIVNTYQIGSKGAGDNYYLMEHRLRVISWPTVVIDKSVQTTRGNVYVVWSGRYPDQTNKADILMLRGVVSGGGFVWDENIRPLVVSAGTEDWMAAPAVSPDGVFSFLYYKAVGTIDDPIYTKMKYSTDGGANFSVEINTGSEDGFYTEGSGCFCGDYQGMASWRGFVTAFWCENILGESKRQVYFRKQNTHLNALPSDYSLVEVDQLDESLHSFGKVDRWNQGDYSSYTVPYTFIFKEEEHQILRADQDYKEGTNQKYHWWEENETYFDMLNFSDFNIVDNQPPIDAVFVSSYNCQFETEFIHGGTSTGKIALQDPWWIYFEEQAYGLRNKGMNAKFDTLDTPTYLTTSTEHMGVLLNQPFDNPPLPYYSIRATRQDKNVNGKTINYDFDSWNYNPNEIELEFPLNYTTAVVFKESDAILTANMKAQRTSDTPQATLANNGRKLTSNYVYSEPGFRPYLVYEDNGSIYTSSQGEGGVWSKDIKIASAHGSIENLTPAVTYLSEMYDFVHENERLIAWAEHNTSTHSYMVRCNRSSFPLPVYEIDDIPYPSVAGYYLYTLGAESDPRLTGVVAFRGGSALSSEDYNDGIRLWFIRNPAVTVLNTESSATFPSVDHLKYYPSITWRNPYYMLAWQQSGGIHYREFSRYHDGDEEPDEVDFSAEVVLNSPYSYLLSNALPSLKSAGPYDSNSKNIVTVAWQATWRHLVGKYWVYTPVVCLREKTTTGNWGTLSMLQTGHTGNRSPVACGIGDMGNRTLYVAYQETGGQVIYVYGYGEMWAYPSQPQISDGNNPAMNIIDDDIHLAWTEVHQSPYRIQTQVIAQGGENMMRAPHFRLLSFNLGTSLIGASLIHANADITLEMHKPTLVTSPGAKTLDFRYTDTLVTPENVFEFEPVKVGAKNSRLVVPFQMTVENLSRAPKDTEGPDIGMVDIAVRDADTQQLLKRVHGYNSSLLTGSDSTNFVLSDTFVVDLDDYVGKQVFLVVKASIDTKTSADAIGIADVYDMRASSYQEGEALVVGDNSREIPGRFRLGNNYPNPFNPSTTVAFDLPQDVTVSLEIFDITGRKIRTLVNEPRSAGTHQVVWNGQDDHGNSVASGLYVYRIQAGDFVQSKKMLFMK